IRHHRERFDGNGYPDKLKGEEIPFLSRILSVADVFDALTTDRAYRQKMPADVAVKIIRENTGSQFDPEVVDVFLGLYDQGRIKVLIDPELSHNQQMRPA
ncbi:MAG: diguanylate cyclase, partial [Proteobacteria bacterium]|nr:diguanylate cyclase [Pseudomonadota bacterium]